MVLGLFFLKYAHKFFWIESAEGNRHRICKKSLIAKCQQKAMLGQLTFKVRWGQDLM